MCDTCGCGSGTDAVRITRPGEGEEQSHGHHHDHDHDHDHPHSHGHHQDAGQSRMIRLEEDILGKNRLAASRNSGYFEAKGVTALNLMSSPGSGKTTLLEKTIGMFKGKLRPKDYFSSIWDREKNNALFVRGDWKPGLAYIVNLFSIFKNR